MEQEITISTEGVRAQHFLTGWNIYFGIKMEDLLIPSILSLWLIFSQFVVYIDEKKSNRQC